MTHRNNVIDVIQGKKPKQIPIYRECPMDVTVLKDMMPDISDENPQKILEFSRFFNNSTAFINIDMEVKTQSKDQNHHTYAYETGAVWRESYHPTFCREALQYPVNHPEQAFEFQFSNGGYKKRFTKQDPQKIVANYHQNGYFVEGGAMGIFHAIYYYITSFENILMWMITEEEAAKALFKETSRYSLESAKALLDAGVDAIFVCSDFGTGSNLLFSKELFRKYISGWLKELAQMCHQRKAFLHLHSHGHIMDLMDDLIDCGVDIINPIGPSDHNDLGKYKERWGDRITLHGGISTQIAEMSAKEMKDHVYSVVEIGRRGGRFFPRTESGIPPMSKEKTVEYINVLKTACEMGYD